MRAIPVFRGTHLVHYLEFCQLEGLPAEVSLRRFGLPEELHDAANIYLPQLAGLQAIKDIGERSGMFDMPARVATSTELSDYGEAICSAVRFSPTLLVALRRLAAVVQREDSSLSIHLKTGRGITWIHAQTSSGNGFECNDWANIMLLMHTVRDFVGKGWQPTDIKLTSEPREFALAQQFFPDSRIFWDPKMSGISVTRDVLSVSRSDNFASNFGGKALASELGGEPGLLDSVNGLIAAYLSTGGPSIERLAEMAGTSSRSLQRTLKSLGFAYSDLLDKARFEKAASLLMTTEEKILDIGFSVGYSDSSHFARSFKRMTNLSPREYRRRHRIQ